MSFAFIMPRSSGKRNSKRRRLEPTLVMRLMKMPKQRRHASMANSLEPPQDRIIGVVGPLRVWSCSRSTVQ